MPSPKGAGVEPVSHPPSADREPMTQHPPTRPPRPRSSGVLLLDCDGVIFDTNRAKSEAFRAALAAYPETAVEAFLEHHRAHGGVSRYEKVDRFFRVVHPVPEHERADRAAEVLELYGAASRRAYLERGPRSEVFDLMRCLGNPPTYVVSGSDQAELRAVFHELGLSGRFADVLGSPTPKLELVLEVLARRGADATDCLFVGDGRADLDVAKRLGIPFVYLAEMAEWSPSPSLTSGERIWYAASWSQLLEFFR